MNATTPEGETLVPPSRTIRALAKAGFVELDASFGKKVRHWTGRLVTVYYVEDAGPKLPNWYCGFEYRGRQYRLRYFDGCFKPFVCRNDRGWENWNPGFV